MVIMKIRTRKTDSEVPVFAPDVTPPKYLIVPHKTKKSTSNAKENRRQV
jgi:hypothetical protein